MTEAYARRATEYADLFGEMSAVHPSDRVLVETWADSIVGPALDAGCGPGHWTDHLRRRGLDIRGIDLVPDFVARARAAHPATRFDIGSLDAIDEPDAALGGVLAWYSLIHVEPGRMPRALAEFARALRPGGALLLGFFDAAALGSFAHAVIDAYRWPVPRLAVLVEEAGFDVVETHRRADRAVRPHGAVWARRR